MTTMDDSWLDTKIEWVMWRLVGPALGLFVILGLMFGLIAGAYWCMDNIGTRSLTTNGVVVQHEYVLARTQMVMVGKLVEPMQVGPYYRLWLDAPPFKFLEPFDASERTFAALRDHDVILITYSRGRLSGKFDIEQISW